MPTIVEVDFNNVTRERHLKARVPDSVMPEDAVVAFDPAEKESLDGRVLTVTDGRAIIDVGGGRVRPRPLALLRFPVSASLFTLNSLASARPALGDFVVAR